ncbi:MAG TPA: hypothetical protein DDY68_03800, partial [Porphyromonadaceae bacterium]|nr:hypothetical protein [Porphyromonadaceae bacterium]
RRSYSPEMGIILYFHGHHILLKGNFNWALYNKIKHNHTEQQNLYFWKLINNTFVAKYIISVFYF